MTGKNAFGAYTWKYATAISPAMMNAAGLVARPNSTKVPQTTSMIAARPICVNGSNPMGSPPLEGNPNIFMVPTEIKRKATTIRKMDKTWPAAGELLKSQIVFTRASRLSVEPAPPMNKYGLI